MNALPDRAIEFPEPSPSEMATEKCALLVMEIVPETTNESLVLLTPDACVAANA